MKCTFRTRLWCVFAILLLGVAASLPAVDLTAEYIDGYLDLKDGDEWIEVFMGDTIPETATVKLLEDSIAEFTAPGVKLTLTKPGIYRLEDLIQASGEQRSVGLASVVGNKVASLFTEKETDGQAAVMGVRGAKSESTIQWMTGDTAELLETGREHLSEKSYQDALDTFFEAYDYAEIDEETEVLFYLGYTSYLMGNLAESARHFGEIVEVDPEAEFFPNLLLLHAQVLIETFAYQEAIDWIGAYGETAELDDSVRQTAFLLEGVSYRSLGADADAKDALQRAKSIDPDTEVARTAETILGQFE